MLELDGERLRGLERTRPRGANVESVELQVVGEEAGDAARREDAPAKSVRHARQPIGAPATGIGSALEMTPVLGYVESSAPRYGSAMSARSIRRSRVGGSTAAAIVALVAVFGVAAPANAQPPATLIARKYVALGDSYAAGQGAGVPLDACLRSTAAYPVLLDAEPRTNLLRQASCSGDTSRMSRRRSSRR